MLLAQIGAYKQPGCRCDEWQHKMDREGAVWCSANIATIVGWLRTEANERKLFEPRETDSLIVATARAKAAKDFEVNAEWLILLACKLVEESREPNAYERYKLRLMRFGNRLISDRPSTEK